VAMIIKKIKLVKWFQFYLKMKYFKKKNVKKNVKKKCKKKL
jgi:hypothetical protein